MFKIEYTTTESAVKIYIFFPVSLSKVRDLLEVVRPAGCGMELVPAELISTIDGIQISDFVTATRYTYDLTRYSVGEDDKVGFAEVTNEHYK